MLGPGDVVERYEIEALLGEGGMARVYRVRHALLGSLHALKVLRTELVLDDDIRQRFLSEGRIQAQLRHPHVAAVTDLVSAEGIAGLVMEYLEGRSLGDRIDQDGPLTAEEVWEVFGPILDAMDHAHANGVVHRDLKPSNLFLCDAVRGRVRPVVLDFGIAKIQDDAAITAFRTRKTQMGTRMGTVVYMSPEQVRSATEVDARSDIFSLGAILYETLIGEPPFGGESDFEVMQRIVDGDYPDPTGLLPTESATLAEVVNKALASRPAERFTDCESFRVALEAAVWGPQRQRRLKPASTPTSAPVAPERSGLAALIANPGSAAEEVHLLKDPIVIVDELHGRVHVGERSPAAVRAHARFQRGDDCWTVDWRRARRGLIVDGEQVRHAELRGGETLEIGLRVFRFVLR